MKLDDFIFAIFMIGMFISAFGVFFFAINKSTIFMILFMMLTVMFAVIGMIIASSEETK